MLVFLDEIALPRPHPTLPGRTVRDFLVEERGRLLPLPAHPACTDQVVPVVVDKTAFRRFDTNFYSVPPQHVRKTLSLAADDQEVRLVEGSTLVARRGWDVPSFSATIDRYRGARDLVPIVRRRQLLEADANERDPLTGVSLRCR